MLGTALLVVVFGSALAMVVVFNCSSFIAASIVVLQELARFICVYGYLPFFQLLRALICLFI